MIQKPDLNKPAFAIFPDMRESVKQDKCPICSKKICESDFDDELSRKEYSISGMCQKCQNDIFN